MDAKIEFTASARVRDALDNLGRTEDIKFSPNNRKLAIAGFKENKILVLDIDIEVSTNEKKVLLTDYLEIFSPSLHKPHGLFFLSEETLIVTNREGEVPILKLPSEKPRGGKTVLPAAQTIRSNAIFKLHSPGSVAVFRNEQGLYEVYICNNYAHYVTRHLIDKNDNFSILQNETLLRSGLNIPDGIALNTGAKWIAVSNHNEHCVCLYENTSHLNRHSEPDGILDKLNYPHGIRFTPDDNFIFVADAGSPYINLYAKEGKSWHGIKDPIFSFRAIDEAMYLKGRNNRKEGGPKGIDIDNSMKILVTTCEEQPLSFFDLEKVPNKREPSKQIVSDKVNNSLVFHWV